MGYRKNKTQPFEVATAEAIRDLMVGPEEAQAIRERLRVEGERDQAETKAQYARRMADQGLLEAAARFRAADRTLNTFRDDMSHNRRYPKKGESEAAHKEWRDAYEALRVAALVEPLRELDPDRWAES